MIEKMPKIENRIEKIENLIKRLNNYKNDFIEDLPAQLITIDDPNYYKYKCRTNWWHDILAELSEIEFNSLIFKDEIISKNKEFISFIESLNYEKFIKKEEIDRANIFLEELINCLEKEKSK